MRPGRQPGVLCDAKNIISLIRPPNGRNSILPVWYLFNAITSMTFIDGGNELNYQGGTEWQAIKEGSAWGLAFYCQRERRLRILRVSGLSADEAR
jgi:hypothetical protein